MEAAVGNSCQRPCDNSLQTVYGQTISTLRLSGSISLMCLFICVDSQTLMYMLFPYEVKDFDLCVFERQREMSLLYHFP